MSQKKVLIGMGIVMAIATIGMIAAVLISHQNRKAYNNGATLQAVSEIEKNLKEADENAAKRANSAPDTNSNP